MWTYSQTSGILSHNGEVVGACYSGHGEGVNNPALQKVRMVGPIPAGVYTIGAAFTHPVAGPVCMRLTPNPGTETFGRDGLMMHGDTVQDVETGHETASEGCIIAAHEYRVEVSAAQQAGDDQLTVTQ